MAQATVPDTGRIVQDPEIMVGKPVVRGSRIPVELVLDRMAFDPGLDDLFAGYPELTIEDVKAVLAFARNVVAADFRRSRRGTTRPAPAKP